MNKLSFDRLPEAVHQLQSKLDNIERLLEERSSNSKADKDRLLSVEEAAQFLQLSVSTIYQKTSKGELPYMKRSKRLYFSKSDLIAYLKEGKQATEKELREEANSILLNKKKGGSHE